MNKHRATFTLDEQTETVLRRTAERLSKSKSEIVREAVQEYGARAGRLSEAERLQLLEAFDRHVPAIPEGSLAAVEAELEEIRHSRTIGGRGAHSAETRDGRSGTANGAGDDKQGRARG